LDDPSRAGDDDPGTGANAGGRGRTGTVGVLIDGVVMLGVPTCGVVIGPAVTGGTVTVGTVTVGTETVGVDNAPAGGTAIVSAPHIARTVRRQRLTD
jgi:hypothetical protein